MTTLRRPTVSIVIPAYNEAAFIKACLEACLAQRELPLEIIVVDNRSIDDTAAIVRKIRANHPQGKLIRLLSQRDEQGLVPTRDYGIARARGDVVGRFDADTIIEPEWVKVVADIFSEPSVDAATGPAGPYDMPGKKAVRWFDNQTRQFMSQRADRNAFLFGSNMAVRRASWQRVFPHLCRDEDDVLHEDLDIAIHMRLLGMKIVYSPTMKVAISGRRLRDAPRDYYQYVMRTRRTYDQHRLRIGVNYLSIAILLMFYPSFSVVYRLYNAPRRK